MLKFIGVVVLFIGGIIALALTDPLNNGAGLSTTADLVRGKNIATLQIVVDATINDAVRMKVVNNVVDSVRGANPDLGQHTLHEVCTDYTQESATIMVEFTYKK